MGGGERWQHEGRGWEVPIDIGAHGQLQQFFEKLDLMKGQPKTGNGLALDRVAKQKQRPNWHKMSEKVQSYDCRQLWTLYQQK